VSPFRFVAVSTVTVSVRLKWFSPLWFVAVSVCRVPVCRRFSQSPFRFVAVLTHPGTKPACGRNRALERIPTSPFRIGRIKIDFVDSWPHLGHVLSKNRDDGIDIEKTRNALCGQINNILCHLSPVVKLKLIKTFCCSLYGSVLWELDRY